ncbi:MAG: complex I NDUFA9 subunit family protein [Sphingomonadaceae bacterium]
MIDRLVTLFGGGGFIGRYAAQQLLKREGVRVRIAQRDPRSAWFLKPLAGVGQLHFAAADITKKETVRAAIAGSDAVVNLVGTFGRVEAIHVAGARNVAEAGKEAGAQALVHISAIGADPEARSRYAGSKGRGEEAVRQAFPTATILRPSTVFGPEDQFINRFARIAALMPAVPVIAGDAKFQPVYAADVGRAIVETVLQPHKYGGKTYELGGPETISMRDLNRWILEKTGRRKPLVEIPDAMAAAMAKLGGWAPGAPITWDQWLMLQDDNIVAKDAPGFAELGISPVPLDAVAEGWLTPYRRQGRFAGRGEI